MAPFLHVVYQPTSSRPAVDLVFVHGLNPVNVHNHAYHTWTHPNGVCWPKDLLPKTAPQSRVFVFGYNSNVAFNVSTAGLRNHADALLHLLLDARGADTHPIIFVCHSLGGLVVKQALVRASLNRQPYGTLKDCTHSIAFFGTPHKGGHGVSFGKIIAGVISTFAGEEKNTLLGALAKDSSLLTELNHNFSSQLEDYQFISFFETKAMRKPGALTGLIKMVIVSAESSTLGLSPQRERQIGLDSNHSEICKLAAADDKYRIIVSAIPLLVNQALVAPKPGHGTAAQSVPPSTESSQMEPVPTIVKPTGSPTPRAATAATASPIIPQQDVLLHKGFDSWLKSFGHQDTHNSAASPLEVGATATSNRAENRIESHEQAAAVQETQNAGAKDFQGPRQPPKVWLPIRPGDTEVNISVTGNSKTSSGRMPLSFSVVAGLSSRVGDLIDALLEHGFDEMEGLWCKKTNTARGPMAHESVPYRIFVTAGPSCYDIEKGLKIHKTELFEDFYRQLYKSPVAVTLHNDTLSIEGGTHCPYSSFGVDIQLVRTLRLPDDAEAHDLPAGLGPLPLINSLLHLTTLPLSMREKGGILVPMLQREAMWILFRSKDPMYRRTDHQYPEYAIRVFTGGINAISGRAWSADHDGKAKQATPQDYIVVPQQPWLDGIAIDSDHVRQFVAMPIGSGYSIEKQLTGQETIGGLQFEITPRHPTPPDPGRAQFTILSPCLGQAENDFPEGRPLKLSGHKDTLEMGMSPEKAGLGVGSGVLLSVPRRSTLPFRNYYPASPRHCVPKPYAALAPEESRASYVHEFFTEAPQPGARLDLEVIHRPIRVRIDDPSKPTGPTLELSPFLDLFSVAKILKDTLYPEMGSSVRISALRVDQRHLSLNAPGQIFDYGIQDGSYLGIAPSLQRSGLCGGLIAAENDGWDMGLAAGARIKQSIYKDPDPTVWDYNQTRVLNIQILNSIAFQAVTGLMPPPSPVTPELYRKHGIPFYSYLEDSAVDLTSLAAEIKSVGIIDTVVGARKNSHFNPSKPTVCSKCGRRLCTAIMIPCIHTSCEHCVATMTPKTLRSGASPPSCFVCGKVVQRLIEISAAMGTAEGDRMSARLLQEVVTLEVGRG